MTKLITRTSVNGATLTGAQLKTALVGVIDTLNSSGLQEGNRTTLTGSATLALTQCGLVVVDCTSASVTLTLPASGTSAADAVYDFRRIDTSSSNTLTIQRAGADTIDGATSVAVLAGCTLKMQLPAGASTWRVSNVSGSTAANARKALGVAEVLLNPGAADYSAVATIDLTSLITSEFDEYRIEIYNLVPATNATNLQALVSTNNGSTWITSASSYSHARAAASPSAVNAAGSNGDTKWEFFSGLSNGASTPAQMTMKLRAQGGSGNASMNFEIFGFDGTNVFSQRGGGYSTSANINALRFQMSSGNISARVRVYGLVK